MHDNKFLKPLAKRILAAGLLVSMVAAPSIAAEKVNLRKNRSTYTGVVNALKRANASQSVRGLEKQSDVQALGLSKQNAFEVIGKFTDKSGKTHFRQRQTFRGVPIWGEHVNTRVTKNGMMDNIHGKIVKDLDYDLDSTTPSFSGETLLAELKQQKARKFADAENVFFANEKSELVIFVDDDNVARLAYEVSFFMEGAEPARPFFIVDAHDKSILKQWDGLTHADVGTGPGGNEKMGQYEYGTDYGYLDVAVSGSTCTMENSNVRTVNLNHGTSGSTAYSFSCYRNTTKAINGAYSPLNDAHYFGNVVYDMYQAWIGVPPLTFQLQMRVHYSTNYENAFWNGTSMTFGDGYTTFHPLVSLDVSAHEVSHGFTEQNSNLTYSGMSGGINESFSDMAGEAAEFYMRGSNDYAVGAEIFKAAGALRYMNDPTLDGKSIGHTDDYYAGMDVHYSSGVYNKAFYLLATTSGWSVQKAFQTFTRANRFYWGPSETFNSAACGTIDAADDLGFDTQDVIDALAGVGAACPVSINLAEAVDNLTFTWTVGGDADFYGQTGTFYYGGDAGQSGVITHNQDSFMQTTASEDGTFSFYWKVSSESNYDYLRFYVNGVQQAAISGTTSWAQASYAVSAGATVKWAYTKDGSVSSGSDAGWVDKIEFTPGSGGGGTTLGDAVDNTDLTWTTGGNADFFYQTSQSTNDGDAAEGGNIDNNQETWMETTVTGPGTFTFYWKVSSESSYDYLEFWDNSTLVTRISGSTSWAQVTRSVGSGTHTLKFRYDKDYSVSSGSDTGWIDYVTWTP
jgi:Zn-dependent metalloprotease